MPKRAVKVYAVEAIMKNNVKKGAFVRLQMSGQEHETTPIYSQISELKWNQSFTMKMGVGEELIAKICVKDDMEEEVGRASINTNLITNKKFQLAVINEEQN